MMNEHREENAIQHPPHTSIDFIQSSTPSSEFSGSIPSNSFNSDGIKSSSSSSQPQQRSSFNSSPATGLAGMLLSSGYNNLKEKFVSWKSENVNMRRMKNWSQFTNKAAFSLPKPQDVPSRLKSNLIYFQTNYIGILIILSLYSVFTNMALLFAVLMTLGLTVYLFYWRAEPIMIGSRMVTDREKMIGVAIFTVFTFWLTSATDTILWIVGATVVIVGLHSLFYTPAEDSDYDFNTSYGGGILPS
eukprot:TRINITY_DN6075_c0_g1_i1.p1 TRINITY_DN6075_c0_g1~~TRINITY_DN6075_c0_g1_i1.p1  ORF type:complete len:245 (+),score=90.91 TRINITY_DN6075_c0_g1_i1:194-928(+)